jgi:hypothetical protein
MKLHVLFRLRIYFQRMSVASDLIQLWRRSLVRTSCSLDKASRRLIKLQILFLLRINLAHARARARAG